MKRILIFFVTLCTLMMGLGSVAFATDAEVPYSADLNGRGKADNGRNEPQYVGQRGYLGYYGHFSDSDDSCLKKSWMIPTYTQDKQFWVESGTIEHKTEVTVISQDLNHKGYGNYEGMLLVERLDDHQQFYVNVSSFITKPYWTYDDLREASLEGDFLAEYYQVSDYYPVSKNNEKVELKDGFVVLVTGPTGLYGRGGPDSKTNQIEALVFRKWKYGYGGVSVFFSQDDLTIIY